MATVNIYQDGNKTEDRERHSINPLTPNDL
jgi:hypothetical protein